MEKTNITKEDMDNFLKEENGWICIRSADEYIYDFHLKFYPIIVKVASTIKIDTNVRANKNSSVIRIFAVRKEDLSDDAKITGGLVKSRILHTTSKRWEILLKKKVLDTIESSKIVYRKLEKKC